MDVWQIDWMKDRMTMDELFDLLFEIGETIDASWEGFDGCQHYCLN